MKINKLTSAIQKDMTSATYTEGNVGLFSAESSEIVSKNTDDEVIGNLAIPQELVEACPDYGKSTVDGQYINVVDFENRVYNHRAKEEAGEMVPIIPTEVIDISQFIKGPLKLKVERGGTVTFKNKNPDTQIPSMYSIKYMNEVYASTAYTVTLTGTDEWMEVT